MLRNKKIVRNIIVILMAIILTLGIFINTKNMLTKKVEIDSIAGKEFEKFKNSIELAAIDLDDGIIIPMYKPQWEKVSSSIDVANKKITVVVKGYAYNTQTINSDVSIDYGSDVDSTLSPEDITLFIDGTKITSATKPKIEVSSATTSTNETTQKTEVTHTITISEFEESTRVAGVPFKEWSGNIKLKIEGRGKESSTYNADVLTDDDGNQNMMETDEGQTPGTWIDVTFEDDAVNKNTNGKLFTDFIKPEFTYQYANTTIGDGNHGNTKKVTIVFDVVDKYFKQTTISADNITVKVDDEEVNSAVNVNKVLTKIDDIEYTVNGVANTKIGEKYQLEITGLDKGDGSTYSGPMTLAFAGNIIEDNSGNKNSGTTITIGVDETDGNENETAPEGGVVVDVVDPIWEKVSASADSGEIVIRARDKYLDSVSLGDGNIIVYVNGIVDGDTNEDGVVDATPTITKQVDLVRYIKITEGAGGNEVITEVGNLASANAVEYKITLGNLTIDTEEYVEFTPSNASDLVLIDNKVKYRKENGGTIEIEVGADTITDKSGNTNEKSDKLSIGNMDTTNPQVYDIQKTPDATNDKLTFVFNVTDRNYDPEKLIQTSELTLSVDGVEIDRSKITSFTYKEIKHPQIDGIEGKVLGHQYTAVVEDFVETDAQFTASGRKYRDLSGTVQIKIAESAAKDKNGNALKSDTTTISQFIDYIKPEIQKVIVANPKNTTDKTYTMSFNVLDKYIDTTNLVAKEEITVYIDGVEASSITKELTSTPITVSCKKTVNGVITNDTHTVGHTYTLVLGGFEQTELQAGKNFMEWSGTVSIQIAQNAVTDIEGVTNTAVNTLDSDVTKRTVTGELVDFIKPVVETVSTERGTNSEIIYFNVIDKYLNTSDLVDKDTEIKVYVDGEEATEDLTMELTRVTENDVSATVNGTAQTVSQQYKLEISGFEQTSRNTNSFKDWSGTVSVEILETAVKDTSNNNLASEVAKRTLTGDFVDFIKPDLRYIHQSTDINTSTKKYIMTFDVTDKYYTSGQLQLSDLTIQMQNGQKDASGNPIVYNLNALDTAGTIDLELTATPYYAPQSVKVTNASTGVVETKAAGTHQIGHTYTLTVSKLEKLELEAGLTTANYSGIVTVAVAANKIVDRTIEGSSNGNDAKTITSGVNIPGGSGTGTVVDVVDPLWTKVSSSASAIDTTDPTTSTATLTIKGTDTYLKTSDTDASTLTNDEIEIYINGTKNTSITPTIDLVEELEETRTSGTVKYGVKYTISLAGFAQDANQVKIRILEDAIKDETGNGNKETDFIIYNVLKSTSSEQAETSAFLGESVGTTIYPEGVASVTPIARQNIEKVVLVNSTAGSKLASVKRVWDVSAQGDDSIIAWTSQTSAPYTVYIGSDSEIFANQDSSYLFSYIGYGESCTVTTNVITDLDKLNTSAVTNMSYMFNNFGYRKMTVLNLSSFDTTNVTNMSNMFNNCGNMAMTTLNLGTAFKTNKVTDMSNMFNGCGQTEMTSFTIGGNFNTAQVENMSGMFQNFGAAKLQTLSLGDYFYTNEVTDMSNMFNGCGQSALTTFSLGTNFNTAQVENMSGMFQNFANKLVALRLGASFYTSEVTDMSNMFNGCGATSMTTLDLGENFNTAQVENMSGMFQNCGTTALTSLDLGNQFYTTVATDMSNMFNGCGTTAMKILDLGPVFTKIVSTNTDFITNTGKSGECIIYAPESIYKNKTAFKQGTTDTTTSIAYTNGTINPIYRPQWEKVSSEFDNASVPTQLKVNLKGTAAHEETLEGGNVKINYSSTVTTNLTANDIQVYINGELDGDINKNGVLDAGETPSITKNLTQPSPATGIAEATHTLTLSGFEQIARQTGVPFKEWSGNISIRIGGRGEATSTYSANELKDTFGNQSMMQTDETGTWLDVIYKDEDSTTNVNTNGTMFIDTLKPELTYRTSETTIGDGNHGNTKKVTIIFDVVDKYYKQSTLTADDITVKVDAEEVNSTVNVNKVLTKVDDIKYTVNGVADTKIGEKYQLEITGLDKGDGSTYSGPMTLAFAGNKVEDKSGNKNNATTITIGVDETDGNENDTAPEGGVIVDVVNPVWELLSASVESGEIVIRAKDKYFASTTLLDTNLTVYANGVASTQITKTLSNPTYKKLDGEGNYVTTENISEAIAVEYTVTLGNITLDNAGYVEFTPTNVDELVGSTAQYRQENGGLIELEIAANVITDDSGNKNEKTKFPVGNMDATQPEVYEIQKTQDAGNNKFTIVFNVTDRNYAPSNLIETTEMTLWIDEEQISNDKITSFTNKEIKALIDGTTKVLGHQYTLEIGNIVETDAIYTALTREFRELSGTLEIRINEDAANDGNGNTLNPDTTTLSDFIDYIKPQVTYQYSESSQATPGSINYSGKTFTMIFDITDKYFEEVQLTENDLTIEIGGEVPNWRTAGGTTGVTKELTSTEIKKTFKKTVAGEIKEEEHVIGKRYTLVLSNLEQLEILSGKQYLDYSGVIEVDIPVGQVESGALKVGAIDTSDNLNNAITITSGIDIKGDVQLPDANDPIVVDVVDPVWEKVSTSANAIDKTAKIKIRGTDKYYASSNLTDKIKVFAHTGSTPGTEVTDITSSVTIQGLTTATPVNKTGTTEQIGDEYTLIITGFEQDVNQIKIEIQEDAMLDTSGNGNKVTEIIAYNTLELTSSETDASSGFLGETSIQRQDIQKVVFVNSTSGSAGATKVWDASAAGDNTIKAWYSGTVPYTVYIGSDSEIFANQNSSYLFAHIGYGANSTVTTNVVTDLNKLNTSSVKNMEYMFNNFGYKAMTELDLGNFDTKNATNMSNMFNGCGQTKMETLDLGNKFDTTKVTDMSSMFQNCGATEMTTLDLGATGVTFNTNNVEDMSNMFNGQSAITTFSLGSNFNTSKVENMSGMFQNFGASLTTLTLGDNFYTTEVTDMSNMFNGCGLTAMTTLDLGDNFNTSTVQNMSGMFQDFAKNSTTMITLDLGNKFYTTSATDMTNMFNGCGVAGMTTLDLGPAFTKLASTNTGFVTNCGKSETVIKATESIYHNKNNFRLDTNSTTAAVNYTVGIIEATYKPIWTKVSSSLQIDDEDIANSTMTVVINGKVDPDVYGDAIKTITSAVTAGNDSNNQITVFVDNENAETITQTIVANTVTETEVQYTITLSNFVELARQTAKGKNFLEWSGNLALELVRGSLVDAYGNKNMIIMDGTSIRIEDETPSTTNVETDKMFADYIKPEFTYEYNETIIGDGPSGDKKVKVVFDVTDKYFKETTLSTNANPENLITVKVDDEDINSAIEKTLTKTAIYVMNKETKVVSSKAPDYEVQSTEKVVGERYELLVENLQSEDGFGYSGPMTLAFAEGTITDLTGNRSSAKTITIGIDDPTNHPEHNTEVVVDVVNPIWIGPHDVNTINRSTDKVSITILGKDKYYQSDVFATDLSDGTIETATLNKIKVYVDNTEQTGISKSLTAITDSTELQTLATNAGLTDVKVGYILTLGNFGTQQTDLSGITKIVIDSGTMVDASGNISSEATIFAGNEDWKESNEPSESDETDDLRYPAFRTDIVDFIDPTINYTYSTVEGLENPDVDYELKKVTVKFSVTDKYLVESKIINANGTLNTDAVKILIHDHTTNTMVDRTSQVTTSITADSADITDGEVVYTLIVSNIQQNPNDGFNFSGTMQLAFTAGMIDDKSGNMNSAKTITLDTEIGSDVVDVVDPIIKYSSSTINRGDKTVTLLLRAEDKYLSTETLSESEATVQVKVLDENGNEVVGHAIINDITIQTRQPQYTIYRILLSNFGVYEGKTSIIIPEDVIKDTSGNGNIETEILIGNPEDSTAFKDSIVDFTKPTWEYVTSSIQRDREAETGTVTLEVKGTDIYFDKDQYFTNADNQLDLSQVDVYIDDELHEEITVNFAKNADDTIKKEYIEENKVLDATPDPDYSRVLKGVKYTLVLGNFRTNEGKVRIEIPAEAICDTSNNGNILTPIDVGNEQWVETDVEVNASNPVYTAFRNDIVDYIKPVIKYQYVENVNPKLDRTNETVDIIFTATDTNFLENNIGLEDMKIYIDDMQVYGTGANEATKITAQLLEPVETADNDGLQYTLRLSVLELNTLLESEIFERHSGVIKIVIAKDQVADTSGNKNIETTIIVDNDDGDSVANGVIADFVNPIIYYKQHYINWEERYALITLRGTDRFYDENTELEPSDLTLYELNDEGQYVQITSIPQSDITITPIENEYGYDFVVRIDNFEEEFKMKIAIKAGAKDENGIVLNGIGDTSGNLNDATEIPVVLDNKRPSWKYVSTDTSDFESLGTINFNVKGVDKFLDLTNSKLEKTDITVIKDGVNITNVDNITVSSPTDDNTEKSKLYTIQVSGLTEMGTYSLVFAKDTLVDEYNNKNAATTISFSNSAIASNTGNYVNVTYHVTPDMETVHSSYVHELMSVNTTGTNFENTKYRPSTLGELFNNGENPLFAEPMYVPAVSGYTVEEVYEPKSFAGWAECDEDGNIITGGNVYGLYDDIPKTVTHLKAVWQDAKVVFVSASEGDNANNGRLPTKAVKDLATAYTKLNTSGTAENNIIVIMDAVEFDSEDALSGNATITSIYAGVDYRKDNNAELKVSSNMIIDGDIIFDNIKLYVDSTDNNLISNYSGNITMGREITTPSANYTFGAIVGGNYQTETSTGELGTHTIRVEAGKYNKIVAGSTLSSVATNTKSATYNVVIGNMRDTAVSRNDKLTITGLVAIGEKDKNYPSGATTINNAADKLFANVILYSGTITSADTAIYLRNLNGQSDGTMTFEMFGGNVTGNIYAGERVSAMFKTQLCNTMKFYGGQVTGNIFGQGLNGTFAGSTTMTLQGNFTMTGNVFGGANITSATDDSIGEGDSTIIVNSSSTTINGNIYGGGNIAVTSDGYVTGNTNITLKSGTVSNIYGGGYNCGNTGTANITIENGVVSGNIYGGAYQNQVRAVSNITVLGGTINGNIYGGNINAEAQLASDIYGQDIKIIIGDTDATKKPTVKGTIYGSGKYDSVDNVEIQLLENTEIISVYGGSDANAITTSTNIYLKGMTVNEIYGGGQLAGTVGTANIHLESGTAAEVYGGGYDASVTESNIMLGKVETIEGTATKVGNAVITTIFGGGSETSGTVTTSNVTLTSGTVATVFGGGNSAGVETSNVLLQGITVDTIYGGSKDAGVTTTSNVTLTSGTVANVFGGGLDVGVTTSNVKQQGAVVTNIYGGNNSGTGDGGDTGTANIEIVNATVENVYGGNYEKGTTRYTNINIHRNSTITGKLYGGGYKSAIGKSGETGSTTINIAGGTINGDINGGSEQSVVYGTTNINIGKDATDKVNTSLVGANINIQGTIYGAGDSTNTDYSYVSVQGNTYILMDNSADSPITYSGSIFGAGNGATYSTSGTDSDQSTIKLIDFGTSTNTYGLVSIERTGEVFIGNSFIELTGRQDKNNLYAQTSYTLNRITKGLSIYNNTTLYTQRGLNMVGGFNSYSTVTDYGVGTKATMENNNKLYTLEGVNLIFAKQEGDLTGRGNEDIWGDVKGMTFFGMYTKNEAGVKQYDENLFKVGTYVEAREKNRHNIEVDGFFKNAEDGTLEVIGITDFGTYYDWIIGADVVNYQVQLIGSISGKDATAELVLDYNYQPETTYTLTGVSMNPLINADNLNVNLINPLTIPVISDNANNTFGLTMSTSNSGWYTSASTNIYTDTDDSNIGTPAGDTLYKTDSSATPGKIKFKLYNSLNITENLDLGFVNLVLTGKTKTNADGTGGNTFIVVIAINIQTIAEPQKEQYTPSFTDKKDTELNFTTDSRVDLSYVLFKTLQVNPYASGDYRVLSTTEKFPAGTRITIKDYGQGSNVKAYYYHVTGSENETDGTRYLYRLSNFTEMGSTNAKYIDSNSYYHTADEYVLEKYDISIDFADANVVTDVNTGKLTQETYLELRNSAEAEPRFNNGDTTITYNLYSGKNAIVTETIVTEKTSYSIVDTLEIPIKISSSILEQSGILDTKYHDQIAGIAIQIVGGHERIKSPELQNFKLKNMATGTEYWEDANGVIRMPIMQGLGSMTADYTLSLAQANVPAGLYTVQVRLYTADDGKYYGTVPKAERTFNITFINGATGQVAILADYDTRIINKSTGANLVEGAASPKAVDMTVKVGAPTNETNIRVELYKRNTTYTSLTDETTYTGTSYTLVDIKDYLEGAEDWETPEENSLITPDGGKEYMVLPMENYATQVDVIDVEFEKTLKEGISTGEYKLVFKVYNSNTLVEELKKTIIVTE